MSKRKNIALSIGMLFLTFFAWFSMENIASIPETPELALMSFYKRQVAEDQIMDPLILAGDKIVPLLEKEVTDPEMPNRRYAIGALGNLGNRSSLPILTKLALRRSEADYIRCDALAAIGMIDAQQGFRLANSAKGEGLYCLAGFTNNASYSRWLESNAHRRSYFRAMLGQHD